MTSMLLSVSMADAARGGRSARSGRRSTLLLGPGLLDVLRDDVLVRVEPFGRLHELAVLDLPDLDEAAAFVVLRRDLERRYQPAQREVADLLESLLRVLAGDLAVGLGLERV